MTNETESSDPQNFLGIETPPIPLLSDASEFISLVNHEPPPDFIVQDLIARGEWGMYVTIKAGGKTWASADLAVAVSTGSKWMGHFQTNQVPVLFIANEGGRFKIAKRLESLCKFLKLDWKGLNSLFPYLDIPDLGSTDDLLKLEMLIERYEIGLIVLDSLYLSIPDISTESQSRSGKYLVEIQRLCERYGCACIFFHHTKKTGAHDLRDKNPEKDGFPRIGIYDAFGSGLSEWSRFIFQVTPIRVTLPKEVTGQFRTISKAHLVMNLTSDWMHLEETVLTRTVATPFGWQMKDPLYYLVEPYKTPELELPVTPKTPPVKTKVKSYMAEHAKDWHKANDVAEAIGSSNGSVRKYLEELAEEGVVIQNVEGPYIVYRHKPLMIPPKF